MSKYHNSRIKDLDGNVFDSKREYRRWRDLQLLERAGEIQDLKRQIPYTLIPTQRRDGRVVERQCVYVADFVYTRNGQVIVEDCKGYRTDAYVIKRKLMLEKYGIVILET